jgi:outer membrane protein OmpA-like peptidoglycan-associated protein
VSTGPIEGADYSTIQIVHRPHLVIATLSSDVLFALGSSELQPGAQTALRQLLPLVSHASDGTVDGYTDTTGNEAINGPLSRARAATVANWLVQHARLPSTRFQVHGFGSADPVAPNGPAGQPLNRRVVITIQQG